MDLIINFQEEELILVVREMHPTGYQIALKGTKHKGQVSLLEHASMQLVNRQDYRLCKKNREE